MFYVHAMFIGNRQKEAIYLFFSGLSLWRRSNSENLTGFKIQAETLMTFAGEFFFYRSRYNVVQIEVSFVSTGRDCDKPEKVNISILSMNVV